MANRFRSHLVGRVADLAELAELADRTIATPVAEAAGDTIAVESLRLMREPLELSPQLTDSIPHAFAGAHTNTT